MIEEKEKRNAGREAVRGRRRETRNRMYQKIYYSETPVSKPQMVRELGLSLPTVHQNMTELLDAGLVLAGETQESSGGRPPVGYVTNADFRWIVSVSVTSGYLRTIALNLKMEEIAGEKKDLRSGKPDDIGCQIAESVSRMVSRSHLPDRDLLGVGISFPGVIDYQNEKILFAPSLGMNGVDVRKITGRIPYPAMIMNNSTCGGYAEWMHVRGEAGKENFAYISLENGVGGNIFIHGEPYLGDKKKSAEFGHMCLDPGGRKCSCGKRGCLEAYCSASRFTTELGITIDEFFERVRNGDESCRLLWEDVLDHLAQAAVNIRLMLDCDIILGGFTAGYLNPYLPELREKAAERNPFEQDAGFLSVSDLGEKAALYGIAWQFILRFISEV